MGFPENRKTLALLTNATATGAGSVQALPAGKKQFQITQSVGTGTATSKVQCSVDASNWVDVYTQTVTSATGNNIFESDSTMPYWRGNVTAVGGSPTVNVTASFATD